MVETKYYCDICSKEVSNKKQKNIQFIDTLNRNICISEFHVCVKCEAKIINGSVLSMYGVDNPHESNRKLKWMRKEYSLTYMRFN